MWLIQITTNTEVPADLPEEQASQSSVIVVAARSKAKAKPQKRETVGTTATIPMHERRWIGIEPSSSSTQSNVTEGRRWSNLILQNKILSSKSSFTNTSLV